MSNLNSINDFQKKLAKSIIPITRIMPDYSAVQSAVSRIAEMELGIANSLVMANSHAVQSAVSNMVLPLQHLVETMRLNEIQSAVSGISNMCSVMSAKLNEFYSIMNTNVLRETIEALSTISATRLAELLREEIDLASLEILSENEFVFDGITYTADDIAETTKEEIADIKKTSSLKQSVDKFKVKHWIIYAIITAIIFHYGQAIWDKADEKVLYPIVESFMAQNNIAHVIKEHAYVRENADPRSKIITTILYSDEVEIIEDIPYWYKVKFLSDDEEITGWISKISIEK